MASQRVRIAMLGGFEVQIDGVAVPPRVWRPQQGALGAETAGSR